MRAGSGGNGLIEMIEMGAEGPEQVQTLIAALRGIGWQGEGLELGEANATEKLGAPDEPLVQGEGLHAILEHGLDADKAQAVHQQGPQLPRGGIGQPDSGKPIMPEQVEDVQGIASIGLRLAHDHGAHLCGIAHEHRMPEPLQQRVEPDRVPRALNANGHGRGNAA